jgi:hypothetical protein
VASSTGRRDSEPTLHVRRDSEAMTPVAPNRRLIGHVFTIALGVIGWAVLALPLVGILPTNPSVPTLPILLFVVVILGTRSLAFRLTEGSVLSLDSAYYVAAALSVGSADAGWLVALALTLDASARLSAKRRKGA